MNTKKCNKCNKTKPLDKFELTWSYKKINHVKTNTKMYRYRCSCLECRAKDRAKPETKKRRKEYCAEWYIKNRDHALQRSAEYYAKNKESYRDKRKERRQSRGEEIRARDRKHYRDNANRINAYARQYYAEHPELRVDYSRRSIERRIDRDMRTPSWSNLEGIKGFYHQCPSGHHVDHIIPLRGDIVSGLHVLENLQYLTAHDNLSKGNKFNPEDVT